MTADDWLHIRSAPDGQRVLVWVRQSQHEQGFCALMHWHRDARLSADVSQPVTHWQPLPGPPKLPKVRR